MPTKLLIFFIILFSSIALLAKTSEPPIPVVVSIPPQKYFVAQIAGNLAEVTVMVPQGFEPEDYEPRPQQLKALTHARLYLAIDVPFELTWLKKFQEINPDMKMIFTNTGIKKMAISPCEHGHHHAFSPFTIGDPHIWLSPKLVQTQARNIRDAFIEIDPKNANVYRKNYQQFVNQIHQLDRQIISLFNKNKTKKERFFFVFHPSLGYFAKDYGLTQVPVEKEGKSPTLKQLNELVALAAQHHIKVIFITPEYAPKEAEVIAKAIKGKTQVINPLSEAWLENMKHIASAIAQSFENE